MNRPWPSKDHVVFDDLVESLAGGFLNAYIFISMLL